MPQDNLSLSQWYYIMAVNASPQRRDDAGSGHGPAGRGSVVKREGMREHACASGEMELAIGDNTSDDQIVIDLTQPQGACAAREDSGNVALTPECECQCSHGHHDAHADTSRVRSSDSAADAPIDSDASGSKKKKNKKKGGASSSTSTVTTSADGAGAALSSRVAELDAREARMRASEEALEQRVRVVDHMLTNISKSPAPAARSGKERVHEGAKQTRDVASKVLEEIGKAGGDANAQVKAIEKALLPYILRTLAAEDEAKEVRGQTSVTEANLMRAQLRCANLEKQVAQLEEMHRTAQEVARLAKVRPVRGDGDGMGMVVD